jgi:ATP-dependent DNA ligase
LTLRSNAAARPLRSQVAQQYDTFAKLKVATAYLDGELCGVRPDCVTSFEIMQQVSDSGGGHLTYFAFDLLHLDWEDVAIAAGGT